MRTLTFSSIAAVALALSCAQPASAQTSPTVPPATQTPAVVTPKLNLNMEDEHTLKEVLLKDNKIQHEPGPTKLKAGDTVPKSVALHDFPDMISEKIPQIKSHQFFIAGDQIVIVRPQERKVVEVVR